MQKRRLINKTILVVCSIILIPLIILVIFDSLSSSSQKGKVQIAIPTKQIQEVQATVTPKPTMATTPTPTSKQDAILSQWKKIKEAEDKIVNYNALQAIQCEDIFLNNNLGGIHGWSTSEPASYDEWYSDWQNEIASISSIPTGSKNYLLWKNLIDIDGKIINDDQDVENNCDNFASDPTLNSANLSSYISTVRSGKTEVDNLTTQRNNILKQLGY